MKQDATLVLVRHGETVGQSSVRYYGRTDVALGDRVHDVAVTAGFRMTW